MWQKVAKFKGAEYFRKALYVLFVTPLFGWKNGCVFSVAWW
jgi:hypothetical protein